MSFCGGRQLEKPKSQEGRNTDGKGQGFGCKDTEESEICAELRNDKVKRWDAAGKGGGVEGITYIHPCREIARLTNACLLMFDIYTVTKTFYKKYQQYISY